MEVIIFKDFFNFWIEFGLDSKLGLMSGGDNLITMSRANTGIESDSDFSSRVYLTKLLKLGE